MGNVSVCGITETLHEPYRNLTERGILKISIAGKVNTPKCFTFVTGKNLCIEMLLPKGKNKAKD